VAEVVVSKPLVQQQVDPAVEKMVMDLQVQHLAEGQEILPLQRLLKVIMVEQV